MEMIYFFESLQQSRIIDFAHLQGQKISVIFSSLDLEFRIILDLKGEIVFGAVANVALKEIMCKKSHEEEMEYEEKFEF